MAHEGPPRKVEVYLLDELETFASAGPAVMLCDRLNILALVRRLRHAEESLERLGVIAMTGPEPLMAGAFSAQPVRVHVYPGGRYLFVDKDGTGCWTDPAQRVLLHKLEDVKKVLLAHGMSLDEENMRVVGQMREDSGTGAESTQGEPPAQDAADTVPAGGGEAVGAAEQGNAALDTPAPVPPPDTSPTPVPATPAVKTGKRRK